MEDLGEGKEIALAKGAETPRGGNRDEGGRDLRFEMSYLRNELGGGFVFEKV